MQCISDNRYNLDDIYKKLGFELPKEFDPICWYFNPNDLSRSKNQTNKNI